MQLNVFSCGSTINSSSTRWAGVEVELSPALVARRDDLDHERRGRVEGAIGEVPVQRPVRHAVVVLVRPQIELTENRQLRGCRERLRYGEKLRFDPRASSGGRGIHVPHALPHLVE